MVLGLVPYDTRGTSALELMSVMGPKLRPSTTMVSPPAVSIESKPCMDPAGTLTLVTAGAAYSIWSAAATSDTVPPTRTYRLSPCPYPSSVLTLSSPYSTPSACTDA